MPELPEVETIARGLATARNRRRDRVGLAGVKARALKSPAAEIAATLEFRRIAGVRRVGKHIVFDLEQNGVARPPLVAKGKMRRKSLPARAGTLAPLPN